MFAILDLPYRFVIPHTLFEDELYRLTDTEKIRLRGEGLEIRELDEAGVTGATTYFNKHRTLHLNDCFALQMAEELNDAILMTGDANLRKVATGMSIEVHGVLWAADELDQHRIVDRNDLQVAMTIFRDDPLVYLPADEVRARIRRFGRPRQLIK